MTALNSLWSYPPANLLLSSTDIHVWCAALDQPTADVAQLTTMLVPDERTRAARFYVERDRRRFIVGRGILRAILSRYLRIEPRQVPLCYSPNGKPLLARGSAGPMLQFNLSHSDRFALYAFARERAIGIDIEYIRPIPEAEQIAEAFFSAYERAVFRSIPAHKKAEAFFNCWTRKEAYIKAIGDGFARPLDRFDVSFAPGEQARLLNVEEDLDEPSRWSFHELVPVPGYVATLVVEGHGGSLACWQWQQ